MMLSRQAFAISIFYSIPLLFWFSAQLQFVDWYSAGLQQLFRQTLLALILLQAGSITLLFISQFQKKWLDDVLAILSIMLYPLPFLVIIWLTGSATLSILANGVMIVGAAGGIAFMIQFCGRLIPSRWYSIKTGLSSFHILTAVLIWNFRDLWQGWLE